MWPTANGTVAKQTITNLIVHVHNNRMLGYIIGCID